MPASPQPLDGIVVVDLCRYLPGAYASRELLRLGARVVRVEPQAGDPMRTTAPAWDLALRLGKESVVCDLKREMDFARALCSRADVVLDGFRPGVVEALGLTGEDLPTSVVWCSITGFGPAGRHAARAGHDLNYLGWAGALQDTAPALPPLQIADLAAGALTAVAQVLAALVARTRTGEGARLVVSMTHTAHDLVAYRLDGDPVPRMLTGGLACYGIYETADARHLTVGALEPKFFVRLTELIGRPELAERQYAEDQDALARDIAAVFGTRTLDTWLRLFEGEDVCLGPVATMAEAHADLGAPALESADVPLGAHTAEWRVELGLEN